MKLATTMKEAWQNVEIKMKYFMDPVLMGKRKRTDDDTFYDNRKAKKEARTQNFHSDAKGKTKSKKGKGKGKSKGKTTACKSTTPDGTPICYAFNNPFEWCHGCNRAHVCGRCFKAEEVPKKKAVLISGSPCPWPDMQTGKLGKRGVQNSVHT